MAKVKLAILGVGGRGIGFAKMAKANPRCELVALADNNLERARGAAKMIEMPLPVFGGLDELIAKSEFDALVIATPDYLHREQALAAFKAGKHLLLDKPIATSVPDALTILEASRSFDRVFYMGFNLRHDSIIREIKRLVSETDAVGAPFYCASAEYYNGGRTYMARWNRLKKNTGGLFVHKGTHDFDVLNWINQPAKPYWVSASANVSILNPQHLPFKVEKGEQAGPYCAVCPCGYKCPDKLTYTDDPLFGDTAAAADGYHKDLCMYLSDKDTHDNAMAIVEYDNGARAYHSEVFITACDRREYVVIGDRGHLEADLEERTITIWPRWTKNRVQHHIPAGDGSHYGCDLRLVEAFLRSIEIGERPMAGAIDGVWSVAVSCAAETARAERRVVYLAELLDPKLELLQVKDK